MNNAFEELINRLDWAKNRTSELDDISIESSKNEKQREQRLEKIENQGLWDNYKCCIIHIMQIPEGEETKHKVSRRKEIRSGWK